MKMHESARRHLLIGLEIATSATAALGGSLLIAAPDGSLLRADPTVLAGTPFGDWRQPRVLLVTLVAGGYAVAAVWFWRAGAFARELSMLAGVGLVAFEAAESVWLGFQPLEAVFAAVGASVVALAAGMRSREWPGGWRQ